MIQQKTVSTAEALSSYFNSGMGYLTACSAVSCTAAWGKYLVSPLSKEWAYFNRTEKTASGVFSMLCIIPVMNNFSQSLAKHGYKLTVIVCTAFSEKADGSALFKEAVKVTRVVLDIFIFSSVFALGVHSFGIVNLAAYVITLPGLINAAWATDDALSILITAFKLNGVFKEENTKIDPDTLVERRKLKLWYLGASLLEVGAEVALVGTPLFVPATLTFCAYKLYNRVAFAVFKEQTKVDEKKVA